MFARSYKHGLSITSQISFCATPLRLDAYNRCQFGCAYCFAYTRQGHGRSGSLQAFDSAVLRNRILRVQKGIIESALDEFIQRRIPFQLGGMSDPFSGIEKKQKRSLQILSVLKDFNYPFIISTKSVLLRNAEYLSILRDCNVYIRFSTTVIRPDLKSRVDVGCPSIDEISSAAEELAQLGIPVSFRLQPIIPGFDEEAFKLIDRAHNVGVKHISAEYLKVPMEANSRFGRALLNIMPPNPITAYINMGALKHGGEYVLPLERRAKLLPAIYKYAKIKRMSFGFADNDLLLHSDGASCCGASDLYLNEAGHFDANIVSLAKRKNQHDELRFKDFSDTWIPRKSISTYLNSKARLSGELNGEGDWLLYLKAMWAGEHGPYVPDYFDGIVKTGKTDEHGLSIYRRKQSAFGKALL